VEGVRRRHPAARLRQRMPPYILYPLPYLGTLRGHVAHTIQDKARLLQRVRRLRGQVDAIERALEADADCARVMQLTVSARGAASSLMAELLEDHIRMHVSDPAHDRDRGRARGAKHLIDVVHAYLR
jgi:DNA-binding FrmR family transcriptional regulator